MKPIKTLVNADDMVSLLAQEGELSPAEISEALGIPRPSVYRLIDGLNSIGLTESVNGSPTRLNLRWLHLADRARSAVTEWGDIRALLADLVSATGYTAYFTIRREREAVCLEWAQGTGIGVLALRPGGRLPLYAGAAGRVLLAFDTELETYLQSAERKPLTDHTLVSEAALREDVLQTRRRGYALSLEDVTDGIGAVGVPIRKPGVRGLAALSLAGLVEGFEERSGALAGLLAEKAQEFSEGAVTAV